ncbi:Uncharacterised protein [Mycobacteroides abscessus subsp. abscessus]|uniref:Uncharacterized protein n=2 Tax=Mycobacteroides abscessus TaxID=36809 RepID=A0AB38D2T1_9MYCO|nr:hypothetical protein [Mycobacteroides abscessus]MBE5419561.1 hypothetical protein [Mycobacteroides abscessus]MBE5455740.1 hypothetical protein [Mycobacteroides abscessus]MDO3137916.1 hypothetical protein [Mycobacteroides abscessus subsp. abscessus]CPR93674.1 Uncharacterised protein [Mycobacteroides abscessus]CPS18209.1 Uncharacterised protein [Mycobacteroides abscessus]
MSKADKTPLLDRLTPGGAWKALGQIEDAEQFTAFGLTAAIPTGYGDDVLATAWCKRRKVVVAIVSFHPYDDADPEDPRVYRDLLVEIPFRDYERQYDTDILSAERELAYQQLAADVVTATRAVADVIADV